MSQIGIPARLERLWAYGKILMSDGLSGAPSDSFLEVPPGKQAVVEYVSARAVVPSGQKIIDLLLQWELPEGTQGDHWLTLMPQGQHGSQEVFTASQTVCLRLNAGERLLFRAARSDGAGKAEIYVRVSGYFSDPLPPAMYLCALPVTG